MAEGKTYVDETGFVRKPRKLGEAIAGVVGVSLILGVIAKVFGTVSPITGVAAFISMASITWGIVEYGSSHDVDTWQHRKHIGAYIMLAGCFWVFPGILLYYYFKSREGAYLKKRKLETLKSNLNDKNSADAQRKEQSGTNDHSSSGLTKTEMAPVATGEVKCPRCGAENSLSDHFCGDCGAELPRMNKPTE